VFVPTSALDLPPSKSHLVRRSTSRTTIARANLVAGEQLESAPERRTTGLEMSIFNFLKSRLTKRPAQQPPPSIPNDLIFKSGTDAIEYVKQYMHTEWKPDSIAVALLGQAQLTKGTLCAQVLVPRNDEFVHLTTFTTIKAVNSKDEGRTLVNEFTNISVLGLEPGDLITIMLADRDPELVNLLQDSFDGWVALVIAKNRPIYSLRDGGWRVEKRYEF
jgi:hypothetical protein